jgi:hypothetical protein
MPKPRWDKFEWDSENKKNGNVQHLTDQGRRLRLVLQDKGDGLARIFTGWELKRKKKKK